MSNVDKENVDVAGSNSIPVSGVRKRIIESTHSVAKNNPLYRACHTVLAAISLHSPARKRALGLKGVAFVNATRPNKKKSFLFFKVRNNGS